MKWDKETILQESDDELKKRLIAMSEKEKEEGRKVTLLEAAKRLKYYSWSLGISWNKD